MLHRISSLLPLSRHSPCTSRSFPLYNAWKILLPRCGPVLQASYGRATNTANPWGRRFQYLPNTSHAPERDPDAAGPFSESEGAQVALVTGSACRE